MVKCGTIHGNDIMKSHLATAIAFGFFTGWSLLSSPCSAQAPATPPTQNPLPNPAQGSAGGPAPPVIPGSGLPGTPTPGVTTAATAPLAPASPVLQSPGITVFYGQPPVGRGLPGMPGGPPLNAPIGSQDPAPRYMQPPAIGNVVCDLFTLAGCE